MITPPAGRAIASIPGTGNLAARAEGLDGDGPFGTGGIQHDEHVLDGQIGTDRHAPPSRGERRRRAHHHGRRHGVARLTGDRPLDDDRPCGLGREDRPVPTRRHAGVAGDQRGDLSGGDNDRFGIDEPGSRVEAEERHVDHGIGLGPVVDAVALDHVGGDLAVGEVELLAERRGTQRHGEAGSTDRGDVLLGAADDDPARAAVDGDRQDELSFGEQVLTDHQNGVGPDEQALQDGRSAALGRGGFADVDDRIGRERVGDHQLFLAALDGVAIGEVPRRRRRVGARRDCTARWAVGALLDEAPTAVDLDHRRHERTLRLHLSEIEHLGVTRRHLERFPDSGNAFGIGEDRDLAGEGHFPGIDDERRTTELGLSDRNTRAEPGRGHELTLGNERHRRPAQPGELGRHAVHGPRPLQDDDTHDRGQHDRRPRRTGAPRSFETRLDGRSFDVRIVDRDRSTAACIGSGGVHRQQRRLVPDDTTPPPAAHRATPCRIG